jgi:hypothetical protein
MKRGAPRRGPSGRTTNAGVDGTITTCLTYPDGDDDGFVDGTTPPIAEAELQILHAEGGEFVDRTAIRDPVGNVICAETSSLSQFALGVGPIPATTTTTLPPLPDQLLTGQKLVIRTPNSGKSVLAVKSSDRSLEIASQDLGAGDPVRYGGSLQVIETSASNNTYPLPAGGWRYHGRPGENRGYVFVDKVIPPIKGVTVAPHHLKVAGKGQTLYLTLSSDPRPVRVVLRLGSKRYCLEFGGTGKFAQNRSFSAKNALAPAACPP